MYTQEQIINISKQKENFTFSKYPITKLVLFGSYARGDFNENSHIDIIVEFTKVLMDLNL